MIIKEIDRDEKFWVWQNFAFCCQFYYSLCFFFFGIWKFYYDEENIEKNSQKFVTWWFRCLAYSQGQRRNARKVYFARKNNSVESLSEVFIFKQVKNMFFLYYSKCYFDKSLWFSFLWMLFASLNLRASMDSPTLFAFYTGWAWSTALVNISQPHWQAYTSLSNTSFDFVQKRKN